MLNEERTRNNLEYINDNLRRTRLGNRFTFWFVFVLSVLSLIFFNCSYWWAFPIMVLLSSILEEIMCLKAIIGSILAFSEEKKKR